MGAMLDFDVVDVFADGPFAGNQLAVVHGAGDLTDAQLLALAREFGFSETTFPVPQAPDRYAVRIFTPGGEIPFAGHPTLGTAWVLRRQGVLGDAATQECAAGEIAVRLDGGLVELAAQPRDLVGPVGAATVTALLADLGLTGADLAGDVWVAGAGLSFVHLPVVADGVAAATVPTTPLASYGDRWAGARDPVEGINLYAVTGDGPDLAVHSRVFCPGLSVAEDAATGSAAAGLGIALVATGVLARGGRYEIRQGLEMGRPSRLHGRVETTDGAASKVRVAGEVHPVARGAIRVP
jgi:trans-2,3-dihydro-3-hydroxyanthranilate isomerase